MKKQEQTTVLTYELSEMDIDAVSRFIQNSYWGASLTRSQIVKSFRYSACVGLLYDNQQIGFARAISDHATSAYLKDVFILDGFRQRGFGRQLMLGLFAHPDLCDVPNWYLGTKDAHDFYRSFGFKDAPDGIYMYLRK